MVVWSERQQRPVGPAVERGGIGAGISIHLEHTSIQVDDPVLGHGGAGVETAFEVTLERQARCSDLDHESETRWLRLRAVAQGSLRHRDVRLRLRFIIESDREQDTDTPLWTERGPERLMREFDRKRVRTVVRLPNHELAPEQLESLVGPEYALVDHCVVLNSAPATSPQECFAHVRKPSPRPVEQSMSTRGYHRPPPPRPLPRGERVRWLRGRAGRNHGLGCPA